MTDLDEFDQPPEQPFLDRLIEQIEIQQNRPEQPHVLCTGTECRPEILLEQGRIVVGA